MKTPSITSLLAPATVAVVGVLLLAPVHPAAAGGANGAKATLGTKITTGVRGHPGAVGKLQCVGSYCPLSGAGYKATTTGTYKPIPSPVANPTPIVRDHRGAGPRTKPTRPRPKRDTICAGWFC
jgi:hypothetical protein